MLPWLFWESQMRTKMRPPEGGGGSGQQGPRNTNKATLKTWIFNSFHFKHNKVLNPTSLGGSCSSLRLSTPAILRVCYPFKINLLLAWLTQCILEFFPATNTKNPFPASRVLASYSNKSWRAHPSNLRAVCFLQWSSHQAQLHFTSEVTMQENFINSSVRQLFLNMEICNFYCQCSSHNFHPREGSDGVSWRAAEEWIRAGCQAARESDLGS